MGVLTDTYHMRIEGLYRPRDTDASRTRNTHIGALTDTGTGLFNRCMNGKNHDEQLRLYCKYRIKIAHTQIYSIFLFAFL